MGLDSKIRSKARISHDYKIIDSSLLFWESDTVEWPFYQNKHSFEQSVSQPVSILPRTDAVFAPQCTPLHSGSFKRDMPDLDLPEPKYEPFVQQAPDARYSAYVLEKYGGQERYIYPVNQLLTIDPPAPVLREHLMKRSTSTAVPQVPGILTCPGSDGLNQTDNNVYSDCTPIPQPTAFSSHDCDTVPTDSIDAVTKRNLESILEDEDGYDLLDFLLAEDDEDDKIFRRTGAP